MRILVTLAALAAALTLAACNDTKTAAPPPPQTATTAATGHYCGMGILEHAGPKGQIILASRKEPVWFSSARDVFAFTVLPEEAKDIRALYVSDMAKAPTWDDPGAGNWIDARQAVYVVGSRMKGGMGTDETVPFSDRAAAETFVAANGGRIVAFSEVPRDYVLGSAEATAPQDAHDGHGGNAGHSGAVPKSGHAH
jgi:copper chaperone NosL